MLELAERHGRRVPPRDGVVRGQDEVDGVAQQRVTLEARRQAPRLVLPLVAQHEVEVAAREGGQRVLGLGLDELAAQLRRLLGERRDHRQRDPQGDGLEARDPRAAGDGAGRGGEVGLGERGALQQRARVPDEDQGGIGQADAAAGALEQGHPGLALEHGELLRDGRRRELQRVGDGGDRAALAELVQQAEAAQVEHSVATLPDIRHESESILMSCSGSMPSVPSSGTLMCIGSAAAFGAMAVFGKLAYGEGATVGTLLAVRFALAAAVFWALLAADGAGRELRALGRRDAGAALALGACGYAAQAGCYFAALERIDAGLLSLLLYTFPAIVAAAAIALGRERADGRRLAALALASGGLVLVVAGAGAGALDPLGAALGIAAALLYSTYILVSEGIASRLRPRVLSALVCTGAAVTLTAGAALLGQLRPGDLTAAGWGWIACLAVISTVASISLFFAGLRRVGPTTASILATVEPLVTVLLAFAVFGELLRGVQLAGGALVLAAVLVLCVRPRLRPVPTTATAGRLS